MPRQKRYQIKQKLEAGEHSITRAMEHVAEIWQLFQGHHSMYPDHLNAVLTGLNECLRALKSIRTAL